MHFGHFSTILFLLLLDFCQTAFDCLLKEKLCSHIQVRKGNHNFGTIKDIWQLQWQPEWPLLSDRVKNELPKGLLLYRGTGKDQIQMEWNLKTIRFSYRSACIHFQLYSFAKQRYPIFFRTVIGNKEIIYYVIKTTSIDEWVNISFPVLESHTKMIIETDAPLLAIRAVRSISGKCKATTLNCDFEFRFTCALELTDNERLELIEANNSAAPFPYDATSFSKNGHYLRSKDIPKSNYSLKVKSSVPLVQDSEWTRDGHTFYELTFSLNKIFFKPDILSELQWILTTSKSSRSMFTTQDWRSDNGPDWQKIRLILRVNQTSTLAIYYRGQMGKQYLALDDISLRKIKYDFLFSCTFTEGFCLFQPLSNEKNSKNSFLIGEGRLQSPFHFARTLPALIAEQPYRHFLYVDFTETLEQQQEDGKNSLHSNSIDSNNWVQMHTEFINASTTGDYCVHMQIVGLFSGQESIVKRPNQHIRAKGSLKVSLQFTQPHTEQIFFLDQPTNGWVDVLFGFQSLHPFRILMEAENENAAYPVFFAIRDFNLFMRPCLDDYGHTWQDQVTKLSCTFDDDFCGWRNEGLYSWLIQAYVDSSMPTDIQGTANSHDKFAYLSDNKTPMVLVKKKGILRSPLHTDINSNGLVSYCLRLRYYVKLFPFPGQLQVKLNGTDILFESSCTSLDRSWVNRQVEFNTIGPFFLTLEGLFESGAFSVNELEVVRGSCKHLPFQLDYFVCNFERDSCGIIWPAGAEQLNRRQANDLHQPFVEDHTLKKEEGYVLAVSLITDHNEGTAEANFHPMLITKRICLRFWMNANLMDAKVRLLNQQQILFERKRLDCHNTWFGYEVQIEPNLITEKHHDFKNLTHLHAHHHFIPVQLRMQVHYGIHVQGFVAFDDFYLYPGECEGHVCTFEERPCLWEPQNGRFMYTDLFDNKNRIELIPQWEVVRSQSFSPYHDKTTRTSEGSVLIHRGPPAYSSLRSPLIEVDSEKNKEPVFCLQFYTYISTGMFSNLSILYGASNFRGDLVEILEKRSFWSPIWLPWFVTIRPKQLAEKKKVDLPNSIFLYLLVHPHNEGSYLLLDDLTIFPGACPETQEVFACDLTENGPTVSMKQVCDQTVDCESGADEHNCGTCTFEQENACGYSVHSSTGTQNNVAHVSKLPKPNNMNKLPSDWQSVWYAALFSSQQVKMHLRSPIIRRTYSRCAVEFSFITNGPNLTVYFMDTSTYKKIELWKSSPQIQLNVVNKVNISLASLRIHFRLIFSIISAKDRSDREFFVDHGYWPRKEPDEPLEMLLIESILFIDCNSQTFAQSFLNQQDVYKLSDLMSLTPYYGKFNCSNGILIPVKKLCDLRDDCDDNSDEFNCGYDDWRTNFEYEHSTIHWNGGFQREHTSKKLIDGPTTDRSSFLLAGHSLVLRNLPDLDDEDDQVDKRFNRNSASGAITGITLHNQGRCQMRFAHHTRGDSISVNIIWQPITYQKFPGHITLNLSKSDEWTLNEITFDPQRTGPYFRLILRAYLQKSSSYLALDDFSFTPECFGRNENSCGCQFSLFRSLCRWTQQLPSHTVKEKSIVYESISINELSDKTKQIRRVRKIDRAIVSSKFCSPSAKSPDLSSDHFVGFALSPDSWCDFSSPDDEEDLVQKKIAKENQSARIISLHMQASIDGLLIMKLYSISFGSSFVRMRIMELISNRVLMERNSSQLYSTWQKASIPIQVRKGDHLQFVIEAQLAGSRSYVGLDYLNTIYEPESFVSHSTLSNYTCTFDTSSYCDIFEMGKGNQQRQFLHSLKYPIPLIDHTLGSSSTGAFIYASSEKSIIFQQSFSRIPKWPQVCITFWHTSSRFQMVSGAEIITSDDTFAELSLLDPLNGNSSVFFRSTSLLNNEWRFVKVLLVNPSHVPNLRLRAKFSSTNSSVKQVLAVDDIRISLPRNCRSVTCSFDRNQLIDASCGWHNVENSNLRNWILVDQDTCLAEHLSICDKITKPQQAVLFVDFSLDSDSRQAVLVSDELPSDVIHPERCFEFVYFMEGHSDVELSVRTNDNHREQVWVRLNSGKIYQTGWQLKHVDLKVDSSTGSQEIRLVAQLNQFLTSRGWNFVAIDYVHLHDRSCRQVIGKNPDFGQEIRYRKSLSTSSSLPGSSVWPDLKWYLFLLSCVILISGCLFAFLKLKKEIIIV